MTNRYEVPDVVNVGKAQAVILGQKRPSMMMDNLGVPFKYDAPEMDDFDE